MTQDSNAKVTCTLIVDEYYRSTSTDILGNALETMENAMRSLESKGFTHEPIRHTDNSIELSGSNGNTIYQFVITEA